MLRSANQTATQGITILRSTSQPKSTQNNCCAAQGDFRRMSTYLQVPITKQSWSNCDAPICIMIVCQPLELPCRALVCTDCTIQWFMASNCSEVKCPCCIMDTPLIAAQLKPAPQLIQTLLADILVQCQTCRKEIRAGEYGTHKCEVEPHSSADDMQTVARVLRGLTSTNSQPITTSTGGRVGYT